MNKKHKLNGITLYDVVVVSIVVLITLILVYPLYYTVVASFSDPAEVFAGNTLLWIKGFTTEAYQNVLKEESIWIGYKNTIIYTALGTLFSLLLTIPSAYVLATKTLPFRTAITWFFFITMYVGGGLIPSYLLHKDLGLINTPWVMIISGGVSVYNMIVSRQFFSSSIPTELYEAAQIDGAGYGRCFVQVALPLSKAILAVMGLYYAVGIWNNYYTGLIYLYDNKYFPLQQVLNIILDSNLELKIDKGMTTEMVQQAVERYQAAQGMKYAIIFVGCLPLLIAYPFVQKYFAKGVMIGSVKG